MTARRGTLVVADRALDIPGESLAGSHTATEFVGWYNGHPDFQDRRFDLGQAAAAVVGVGNVAMDVTRILASDPDDLAKTDIAAHALEALRASRVRTIYLLGRRGPAQAAFTNPELKELGELPLADVIVRAEDLELDAATKASLEATPDREAEKNLKTLRAFQERGVLGRPRRIVLLFSTSPVRIEGQARVERPVVGANRLEAGPRGVQAVPTGQEAVLPVGLALRPVGHRAPAVAGVNGRIGLGHAGDGEICQAGDVAVNRAGNATGECPALPKGAANCQHRLTNFERG